MWWNGPGPGWGPMYGWWIMPIFGIVFLVIILFVISRFFGGGFCGRPPLDRPGGDDIKELKQEIQELRDEIKALKKRK